MADEDFNKDAFVAELTQVLESKAQTAGRRRAFKGGATKEEVQAQLEKLHEDDPELKRIAAEMALAADDVTKWTSLRAEFTAQKRKLLIERGQKETAEAVMAATESVMEAAQKLATAGGKAGTGIKAFADAMGSGLRSIWETCGPGIAVVATNIVTARAAFGVGQAYGETHSVQAVGQEYLDWVRALPAFNAALAGAGGLLALQVASNSLIGCARRRAAPAAAAAAAPAAGPAALPRLALADAAPAAAAAAAAAAAPPAVPGIRRRGSKPRVEPPGTPTTTGDAESGGRRRSTRRHRRHRLSAPTRKVRSSSSKRRRYTHPRRG